MKCRGLHPDELHRLSRVGLVELVATLSGELAGTKEKFAKAEALDLAYALRIRELVRGANPRGDNGG